MRTGRAGALAILTLLVGCDSALQPPPEEQPITAFATEACSRRIAQLAAPYHAKGVASRVNQAAVVLPGNRYQLGFRATVDYGVELRSGQISCTVTAGGRVEKIEGMEP